MDLAVMVPYWMNRIDMISQFYTGLPQDTEAVFSLRNCKGVTRVRLWEPEELYSCCLCDVPLRLYNRDGKFCFEPQHQGPTHNTHKGGISRGLTSAHLEPYVRDDTEVELLMAIITEGSLIV